MSEILRRVKGLEKWSGAKSGPYTILYKDDLGIVRDCDHNMMAKDEQGAWRDGLSNGYRCKYISNANIAGHISNRDRSCVQEVKQKKGKDKG